MRGWLATLLNIYCSIYVRSLFNAPHDSADCTLSRHYFSPISNGWREMADVSQKLQTVINDSAIALYYSWLVRSVRIACGTLIIPDQGTQMVQLPRTRDYHAHIDDALRHHLSSQIAPPKAQAPSSRSVPKAALEINLRVIYATIKAN